MNARKSRLVEESGLYLATTGRRVRCQNPTVKCDGRAVTCCPKTKVWLCQECADAINDVAWGFGA